MAFSSKRSILLIAAALTFIILVNVVHGDEYHGDRIGLVSTDRLSSVKSERAVTEGKHFFSLFS